MVFDLNLKVESKDIQLVELLLRKGTHRLCSSIIINNMEGVNESSLIVRKRIEQEAAERDLERFGEYRDQLLLLTKKVNENYEFVKLNLLSRKVTFSPKSLEKCIIEGTYFINVCILRMNNIPKIYLVYPKKQTENEQIELFIAYTHNQIDSRDQREILKEFITKINDLNDRNLKLRVVQESPLISEFYKYFIDEYSKNKDVFITLLLCRLEESELFLSQSTLARIKFFSPLSNILIQNKNREGNFLDMLRVNIFLIRKEIEQIFRRKQQKDPFLSTVINPLPLSSLNEKVSQIMNRNNRLINQNTMQKIANEVFEQMMIPSRQKRNLYEANLHAFLTDIGMECVNHRTTTNDSESSFWNFRFRTKISRTPKAIPPKNQFLSMEMRYSEKKMIEVVMISDTVIMVENRDFLEIKSMFAHQYDGSIDLASSLSEKNQPSTNRYLVIRKYDRDMGNQSILYRLFRMMNLGATIFCLIKDEFSKTLIHNYELQFDKSFFKRMGFYLNWSEQTFNLIMKPQLQTDIRPNF